MIRVRRTKQYNKDIEKQWVCYFWNFILKNIDKHKSWNCLSLNPTLTWDIVKDNLDKPWVWESLSKNSFKVEKETFVFNRQREYMAAYRIQQCWFNNTMSPEYAIGRKFIEKRRRELFDLDDE